MRNCQCKNLWLQDFWNNRIFNRIYDINADRFNQVLLYPRTTNCHHCITSSRQKLLDNDATPFSLPDYDLSNYRDVPLESELSNRNRLLSRDCMIPLEKQALGDLDQHIESQRAMVDIFSSQRACQGNDHKVFYNVTKELYKTVDVRNCKEYLPEIYKVIT